MLGKNKKQKEINIFDNIPTMADILLPETLQEKKDYLILGYNKFTRIFAMTIYPEQTWVSWLDDLFHIGNINISVKIEPSSNGNVINQLTKKLVQSQSEYATILKKSACLSSPCFVYLLFTAKLNVATFILFACEYLISGFLVNLPNKIILFIILFLPFFLNIFFDCYIF